MWTILFDIDGTLIRSGGAGMAAVSEAMNRMFGACTLPEIEVSGRTDFGILSDIFTELSLDLVQHLPEFNDLYCQLLQQKLPECNGAVLPGVRELLTELDDYPHVSLGLLTGNAQAAARIKLEHFGLHDYFLFGGYGDAHAQRSDVAELARRDAQKHLGQQFDAGKLWVIGDTIHDVQCARSINSRVVTVETGGACREELLGENPDIHLTDLSDCDRFISEILATPIGRQRIP
jgi:phosphoglycolate phosphatase-like HAD superfamily hydrolase